MGVSPLAGNETGVLMLKRPPRGTAGLRFVTREHLPILFMWIAIVLWFDVYQKQSGALRIVPASRIVDDLYNWLHALVIIAAALLLKERQFARHAALGASLLLLGFAIFFVTPDSVLGNAALLLAAPGLGLLFASACYFYVAALNNSEKFWGMVAAFLLTRAVSLTEYLVNGSPLLHTAMAVVVPLALLTVLFICAVRLRGLTDGHAELADSRVPVGMYFLLLMVAVVMSFSEDIAFAILKASDAVQSGGAALLFPAGAIVGVGALVVVQRVLRKNIVYVWNSAFVLLVMGFLINLLFLQERAFSAVSGPLFGCSYAMSYISMYFLMGVIAKKYKSLRFFRAAMVVGTAASFISYFATKTILAADSEPISAIFVIVSVAVIMVFLLLSPRYVAELYHAEWADDLNRIDVTYDSRLISRLKEAKLSPKEIEVCQLLLQGYTMRQIAGTLSIAYSTVNTYCTSAYRKLGINSRTELLLLLRDYGVA